MSMITLTQDRGGMSRNSPLLVEASEIASIVSASESSYHRSIVHMRNGEKHGVYEWPSDIEKMVSKAKPSMTDAELLALAALANVEAVQMAGDNADRAAKDLLPMWLGQGTGTMPAGEALRDELHRRGITK